jgi:hypothetical protein
MTATEYPRRKGYVNPSVNATGTDTVGYTCEHDPLAGYRFSNGSVASQKLTDWHTDYSEAIKNYDAKRKKHGKTHHPPGANEQAE